MEKETAQLRSFRKHCAVIPQKKNQLEVRHSLFTQPVVSNALVPTATTSKLSSRIHCVLCNNVVVHDPLGDPRPTNPFTCLCCRDPCTDYFRQLEIIRVEAENHRAEFYAGGNKGIGEGPRGVGYVDLEQYDEKMRIRRALEMAKKSFYN